MKEKDIEQFNQIDFIIKYEGGLCTETEIIAGFQQLINSGVVWQLQGHYGRTATALLENGLCTYKTEVKEGR